MTDVIRVGLLGHGIGPSLSPALHMQEGERLGLDYRYEIVDLTDVPDADLAGELDRLEGAGFRAVNVTHPFKQQVLRYVSHQSDVVRRIGSANLVLFGADGRTAHNTDYVGFRTGLEAFLGTRSRGTVLQVGAGGAGLATACVLADLGFEEVLVHDRRDDASRSLVERFSAVGTFRVAADVADLLPRVDGVVHVTPQGMSRYPGTALEVALLGDRAWVAEVVYRPLVTELVRQARARGLDVLDGGAMAVGQAWESLRLVTGQAPDMGRMTRHFHELVGTVAESSETGTTDSRGRA
jgi:shikimate dehydrogenase